MSDSDLSANNFEYKLVTPILGQRHIEWEVTINGYSIKGEAVSIRQAYRRAKRSVKRYRKMKRLLDANEN